MSEANYSKEYIELTHKHILESLERIENQTKSTTGRVDKLEERQSKTDAALAKYLNILSGHSVVIKTYKEEKDRAQEKLIQQQEERIKEMQAQKEADEKAVQAQKESDALRVRNAMITAILLIASSIGLVKWEFIKQVLLI
jgi:hypothetical protein